MTKKIMLLPMLIVGLFASACVSAGGSSEEKILANLEKRVAPQKARLVVASLPLNATVADLFVSKKREHMGFNIPTLPMSVGRSFLLPAPLKMKSYKLFYKLSCGAEITAAGFWRFITNAHVLFYNKEKRRLPGDGIEYLNTVKEAIEAHKTWFANQTEETRLELNKKEDAIMKLLAKLPLSDHKTRYLVEQMLSTSVGDHKRLLSRATMSNSSKKTNANAHPKGFIRTCAENFGVNVGSALVVPVAALTCFALYDLLVKGDNGAILSKKQLLKSHLDSASGKGEPLSNDRSGGKNLLDRLEQTYPDIENGVWATAAVTVVVFAYLWGKDIYDWATDYNLIPEPVDGGIKVIIKLDPFLS